MLNIAKTCFLKIEATCAWVDMHKYVTSQAFIV